MEVVVTTGAISHAKLQSNHHHQHINTRFFTGRMPFLSPNQQCQSTEGKKSHHMDLLTPNSSGGLPTLILTTNGFWLPHRSFAMPLISPLMPVPQYFQCDDTPGISQCWAVFFSPKLDSGQILSSLEVMLNGLGESTCVIVVIWRRTHLI